MRFALRVLVAEDRLSAWAEPLAGAVVAAVAPLADLGDELEVAQELVVDEVVVAPEVPQEVRPRGVDLEGELVGRELTTGWSSRSAP